MKFSPIRMIVRTFIPELYTTYKTAAAAERFLREIGLSYRRQDFLADWREINELKKKEDTWKYIRKDLRPSDDMFVETELDLRKKYQYIGKFHYINRENLLDETTISFTSDKRLRIMDIEDKLSGIIDIEAEKYQVKLIYGFELLGGKKRK